MSFKFGLKRKLKGFTVRLRSYTYEDRLKAGKEHLDYVESIVPEDEWSRYGFHRGMTYEEALQHIQVLNASTKLRDSQEKKARFKLLESEKKDKLLQSAYLPEQLVKEFEKKLTSETLSLTTVESKMIYHWKTAMRVISSLSIAPEEWGENRMTILVALKGFAPSTVVKQINLLNSYGSFYCKKLGKYFESILVRSGDLAKLGDHYLEKTGGKTKEALGVTLSDMETIKISDDLSEEEKRWCVLCLGFGLRPSEVESIVNMSHGPKTITVKSGSVVIYQPKLTNLPRNKRYKEVLISHQFQKDALKIYLSGEKVKMPSRYMIKKVLKNEEYGLYSFRKGYEGIMINLGSDFIRASKDLGHASIERTYRNYRKRISLTDD